MKLFKTRPLAVVLVFISLMVFRVNAQSADPEPEAFQNKRFNINVQNSELKDVLRTLALQGGLVLKADQKVKGKVTYGFKKVTLGEAMKQISLDQGLSYSIKDGALRVSGGEQTGKLSVGSKGSSREPASVKNDSVHEIKLQYLDDKTAMQNIHSILGDDTKLVFNRNKNSILLIGSEEKYEAALGVMQMMDVEPKQILLQAQIIETTDNFGRQIGLNYQYKKNEDATDIATINGGALKSSDASLFLPTQAFTTSALYATLSAAENAGEIKTVSRPKIVTVNNEQANMNSGISYKVKVLGLAGGASSTSGVETVTAGLTLSITPTIVGEDHVKMEISINNSEPGDTSVDGIPAVVNNAIDTKIIVKQGQTATLAGLIKKNESESSSRVPLLSDIPIINLLFTSHSENEFMKELMIFITPKILSSPSDLANTGEVHKVYDKAELSPEVQGKKNEALRVPASAQDTAPDLFRRPEKKAPGSPGQDFSAPIPD